MQNKKKKADRKGRNANNNLQELKRHVSFSANVALLEASARNDPDEGKSSLDWCWYICEEKQLTQYMHSFMIYTILISVLILIYH